MTVILEFGLVYVPQMTPVHFVLRSFSNYIRSCLAVYIYFNLNSAELGPVVFPFQK